jgi:2-C-methyl-D-erythritol 4-phosphate cytidylyltransferase
MAGAASTVWAIVVAAGRGDRFGSPKQYERLGQQRVIDYALAGAREHADGVVLVVPPERAGDPEPSANAVVAGAGTRSGSVRAGLTAVPEHAAIILVHDAARPFAPAALWSAVTAAVAGGADAAIPVVPVTDTLRQVDGATVDRGQFVAVQTPQAFRADLLRTAHEHGHDATDDAALVEAIGATVVTVRGEPMNRKITTKADLAMMAVLVP